MPTRDDLPPPGAHGGDGPAVAAALGRPPAHVLDLSQSLNPFAPDVGGLAARHLQTLRHYPDVGRAHRAAAETLDVEPERLLLTNGGSEAIALVAGALGGKPQAEPEFSLHPRGLMGPRWRSDPHNPSGALAGPGDWAQVWDEAFYPLASGEWTSGRNAVIVGSFTKVFACPGLRMGYIVADDLSRFAARQPAWPIGSLGLAVLPEMLATADLPAWRDAIAEQRDALAGELRDRGLTVEAGYGPWVLVDAPGLRRRLAPHGVVVRDCASFGMPGWHRIAVPTPDQMDWLLWALDNTSQESPTSTPADEQGADSRTAITTILFDIGDTLVHAARPGTPVGDLVAEPIGTAVADLTALNERFRLGAVTDTSVMTGPDVRRALAGSGLGDLLEVIVSSVDVGAPKPDPRGLMSAMHQLGASPASTLFVGDSDVDEGAAQRAGVRFVRAGGGRSPGDVVARALRRTDSETGDDAGME